MAVSDYTFNGAVLGAAAAKQGTDVPALTQRRIIAAALVNTTGAPIAATVYLTEAGVPSTANTLISARAIAAGETYLCPELVNQSMNAGGSVWALGNGLTFKYAAKDLVAG